MKVELVRNQPRYDVEGGIDTDPDVRPSRRMARVRLHVTLVILDIFCIVASFGLSHLVYPPAGGQWSVVATVITLVYLGGAVSAGAYAADISIGLKTGVTRALRALLLAAATVLFVAFYFKASQHLSRVAFAISITASSCSIVVMRTLVLRKARAVFGGNPYTVVLITENPTRFPRDEFSRVISAFDFDPAIGSPMMFDRLGNALRGADRVVLDCSPEHRLAWAGALRGANVLAEIIMPELAEMAPQGVGHFGALPTIVVARGPLGLFDRVVKRLFDLAVAGLALLLLAPLLLAVALLIKIESPGPVFFIQSRIGRGNRIIRVLKFRSMHTELCDGDGLTSTLRDDDRITRVGRFIRMVSIDELPQLVNVVLGSMSIVGPRPHALGSRAEGKLFWEIDERYWHRHAAKPGLTGLAQVRGYRGATHVSADLTDRLHADLEYLNGWSIWRDLRIVFMTFGVIVHKNAY
ncbi:hypothetical protein GCM10009087_26430 [Sphingomonas oligophenolica]|uniref:Sugar transferase n=1 Tax=Sphingomonas oligophenolica TaxID=301154 RepID=A0ABU9YD29_9SPHN